MARRLISLLVLALCAGARGQAFGRFGYQDYLDVPGLTLDRGGFVAKWPGADKFQFLAPSKAWHPVLTTAYSQTIALESSSGRPSKAVANLFSPALGILWESGVALKLACAKSPFLTWSEGSVREDVPTPDVRWVLVSFQDSQPPIVLVFMGRPASLKVSGKAGDWTIRSEKKYEGWMRVGLPLGLTPLQTDSASSLGHLVQRYKDEETLWSGSAPALVKFSVEADLESVTGTWKFDKPGAVVPSPATLAALGGYPLKVTTAVRSVDAPTELGDLVVTREKTLRIRFPARRIPAGRCVTTGEIVASPLGTVSPIDVPSVAELAFDSLLARSDLTERQLADSVSQQYIDSAHFFEEPWSHQLLPYDASGTGIDLAAAHALLFQALTSAKQPTSEANSLLTSVLWRMDWSTWRIWQGSPEGPSNDAARRAAAIVAVTTTLCPEPERRLQGAMLEAGLAAERWSNQARVRLGLATISPKLMESLEGLRRTLFSNRTPVPRDGTWLLTQLRAFGNVSIQARNQEGNAILRFAAADVKPMTITFASGYPIECFPSLNLGACHADPAFGYTRLAVSPRAPGPCEIVVKLPSWAQPLPSVASPLRFVEAHR